MPGRLVSGTIRIRRLGNLLLVGFLDASLSAVDGGTSTVLPAGTLSDGFRAVGGESGTASVGALGTVRVHIPSNGQLNVWIQSGVVNGTAVMATDRAWPTALLSTAP